MAIDFARIRPHDGARHDGFEELCCQLAGCERPDPTARFVRNAPPDAGVECYWVLANGDEFGWQAKYFPSVGDTQWRQLDESVEAALEKHPRLVRYVVCLPIDLPDARVKGRKSLRQRWDERVAKWERRAAGRGLTVAFELWGKHELSTRLTEPAQAGRRLYWFGGTVFSPDWFVGQVREAVRFAGARYTPSLHVELPLSCAFDGLGYTPALCAALRARVEGVGRRWREFTPMLERPQVAAALGGRLEAIRDRYAAAMEAVGRYGDLDECPDVSETLRAIREVVQAVEEGLHVLPEAGRGAGGLRGPFDSESFHLQELAQELGILAEYCSGPELQLVSRPALLLVGPGGYGKTHALCDLADRRTAAGHPTVLLLGQQLGGGDPWQAIVGRLGLGCTRDEFLGALQAAAEAAGTRALLLIDAINETPQIGWRDELPAMLEVLRRYSRVRLAVTCRDVAEDELIREDVALSGFIRVEHTGLAGRIEEAITRFGGAAGVVELHVPVLSVEFASPLFLKLFFRARRGKADSRPSPFHGLAGLFDTIAEDLDERLASQGQLNYHPAERRAQRGIERLANLMLDARTNVIPTRQALDELGHIHLAATYSDSLLARLVGAGILAEDVVRTDGREERVIRFAYDKFGEHYMARIVLSRARAERDGGASEPPTLRWLLSADDSVPRHRRRGLVVAACALAPEILGADIIEVAPWARELSGFPSLYLASLPLRPPTSVREGGVDYVTSLFEDESAVSRLDLFTALLEVAVVPAHPLNARWLDQHLRSMPLPARDAIWSVFLHRQWGRHGPVERLIGWAWPADCETRDPAACADPETTRLAALCLGWFLATPNRFLRDHATKALVSLLQRRLPDAVALLSELEHVDDPYIVERVSAAAYGCATRSEDVKGLRALVFQVFRMFGDAPPPDILVRAYARGCVERALELGAIREDEVDLSRIHPPFPAAPLIPPPTWDELRAAYPEERFGLLHGALKGDMSDFNCYVLGRIRIGGEGGWTDDPNPPPPTEPVTYSDEELEEIGRLLESVGQQLRVAEPAVGSEEDEGEFEALDGLESSATTDVGEEEMGPGTCLTAEPTGDLPGPDYAARWIFRRVVELGWTPERFGAFEREVAADSAGRSPHKPERMSKKYQWIALREFLGPLLDARPYRHRYGVTERYEGPWQVGLRDIDPSFLSQGPVETGEVQPSTWWVPIQNPLGTSPERDDFAWVRSTASIPDFGWVGGVRDPADGREWSVLSLATEWEEASEALELRQGGRVRRVGFDLGTWLVPRGQADGLLGSLGDWDFASPDLGKCDLYGHLLGDYFWSTQYEPLRRGAEWQYGGEPDEEAMQALRLGDLATRVAATTHRYFAEGSGYDCSVHESRGIHLPSVWLAQRLGLRWAGHHADCVNTEGRLIAFDPGVESRGPAGLLLCGGTLAHFLGEHNLTLIVAVVGEKYARKPGGFASDDGGEPGTLVFRRLLRGDGAGLLPVRSRSVYLHRSLPGGEVVESR